MKNKKKTVYIKNYLNRYITQELNMFPFPQFERDYPKEPEVILTRLVVKLLTFCVLLVEPIL